MMLGLGMLGVLVFFFWSWLKARMLYQNEANAKHEVIKHKASAFKSPSEQAALELVNKALALRDPSKVETYFRTGSSTPEAVVAFLESMEQNDGKLVDVQWHGSMDANGLLLEGILINTLKDSKARSRLATLTPDAQGVWKIDFDAFVRKTDPSWEVLLSPAGGSGMVRVVVGRDSYYNGPFADDLQWACYGMGSLDTDEILMGYCRVNTPQALAMERILAIHSANFGRHLPRVTLTLVRPAGAEMRQFEITGILAEGWVLGEKNFDAPSK